VGVPDHTLIHTVTVVEPAEITDAYNDTTYDYGGAAARRTISAWLQQDQRTEQFSDGRDPLDERWLLITNEPVIPGNARIEWPDHPAGPVTFEVDGPTAPTYRPGTGFHHVEARLRIAAG